MYNEFLSFPQSDASVSIEQGIEIGMRIGIEFQPPLIRQTTTKDQDAVTNRERKVDSNSLAILDVTQEPREHFPSLCILRNQMSSCMMEIFTSRRMKTLT